jgi:hypothetical protein
VLFDGRLRNLAAQPLDIRRHTDGFNLIEFEPPPLTLAEEPFDGMGIGRARVAVTNAGSEEFDEASAGPFALGADERRRRLDLVGQEDRRFWHLRRPSLAAPLSST